MKIISSSIQYRHAYKRAVKIIDRGALHQFYWRMTSFLALLAMFRNDQFIPLKLFIGSYIVN